MRDSAFLRNVVAPLAAATALCATASAAPLAFVLGNGNTTLVSFDVTDPSVTNSVTLTGDTPIIDAIDFRPATGQLFGYSDTFNKYYLIDPATGVTTDVSGTITPTNTSVVDIDWNPTIDRLRTVTATDQNIVFNPNTGDASNAATSPLQYAVGDPNEGIDPKIVANGYTNSFAGSTSTTQFVLGSDRDILGILANNSGIITTVSNLTLGGNVFNFNDSAGLDIVQGPGGTNIAYALLQDALSDDYGLYEIALGTGELTLLGLFSNGFGDLSSLTVSPVPVPAAGLLFGGVFAAGALRRFTKRRGRSAA